MCAPCFQAEGLNPAAIAAFKYTFEKLVSGANLMIPESAVKPTESLPDYESLTKEDPQLLKSTVMVKLNGGLGTGMGLEKAKSLLELKDGMYVTRLLHDISRPSNAADRDVVAHAHKGCARTHPQSLP